MNSGVPGSPRNSGPFLHAYQYVRSVPSASRLREKLRPLSRTRTLALLGQPVVEIGARGRLALARHQPYRAVLSDVDTFDHQARPSRGVDRASHVRFLEEVLSTHLSTKIV